MNKILDTPILKLNCWHCQKGVKPAHQTRLAPDECGQQTDTIFWECSECGADNYTPDDLGILDSEVIG